MVVQEEYRVELEVFEGPLDLLLYLIKREEIDIYNIPIETITTQYMEYLNLMQMLDLNIAGEFLVMAATLMMIKSRMLLPVEDRGELAEEEEEEDPRWDLVRQLVAYKKFKDAAGRLHELERRQEGVFGAGSGETVTVEPEPGAALEDVSLFDLITAFRSVLDRARPEQIIEIQSDRFTVADQIDMILKRTSAGDTVPFAKLFGGDAARGEIVCTFLALLELIRLRQVRVTQEQSFGEIVIVAALEAAEEKI